MHLTINGCVAIRFKMLTHLRVRSAFQPPRALPSNKIQAPAAGLVGVLKE